MARDEQSNRVGSHCLPNSTGCARLTDGLGNVFVRGEGARRDVQKRFPYLELKIGAVEVKSKWREDGLWPMGKDLFHGSRHALRFFNPVRLRPTFLQLGKGLFAIFGALKG